MSSAKTQMAHTHANVSLVTMVMGTGVETSMSAKQDVLFVPPRECAKILQAHSHAPARKVTMAMGTYAKVIIYIGTAFRVIEYNETEKNKDKKKKHSLQMITMCHLF